MSQPRRKCLLRTNPCDEDRVKLPLQILNVIVSRIEAVFQNVWLGRYGGLLVGWFRHVLAEGMQLPPEPAQRAKKDRAPEPVSARRFMWNSVANCATARVTPEPSM
jgi:hypothetical protein